MVKAAASRCLRAPTDEPRGVFDVRTASRILIRLPNWLGDSLMARPLLHALARCFPGAERRGIGPAAILEILSADAVLDDSDAWEPDDPVQQRRMLKSVREWRPDLALVLPPSFSSAWFAWRCGARERVGFAHEGRSALLTDPRRRGPRGDRHLSEEYLSLLGDADASDPVEVPTLRLLTSAHSRATSFLAELALGEGPLALLGPGAIYGPAKRWAPARFAELAQRLRARGFVVLVCGAPAESGICDEVARAAGVKSAAGVTDLLTQAGLCAKAALAVCNDSGLAHLAAAVGTPTVALFGSTSSAWSAPLGPRVRIVQHAPVCSPCFRRTCRIGYRCLTAIEVGEVERACRELAA
jgi:heptosyltransferase-2